MKALLFSLVFLTVAAFANDDYQGRADIEKLQSLIERVDDLPTRLEKASAFFLGRAYAGGPLGEGKDGKYDNDPLCRTDKFDCTTYLETVMAAALTKEWKEFTSRLDRIRYDRGRIGFLTRNHFPEIDWIPNNVAEKIIVDVTREVGGKATLAGKTTIKKAAWFGKFNEERITRPELTKEERTKLAAELKVDGKDFKDVDVALPYIPFSSVLAWSEAEVAERAKAEAALKPEEKAAYRKKFREDHPKAIQNDFLKKLEHLTIVNFVHPDRPLESAIGTNMNVTHQGLLVRKDGVLYLRHAAVGAKVLDVPFVEYIDMFTVRTKFSPQGFNLVKLQRP